MRTGECGFLPTCKHDHPMQLNADPNGISNLFVCIVKLIEKFCSSLQYAPSSAKADVMKFLSDLHALLQNVLESHSRNESFGVFSVLYGDSVLKLKSYMQVYCARCKIDVPTFMKGYQNLNQLWSSYELDYRGELMSLVESPLHRSFFDTLDKELSETANAVTQENLLLQVQREYICLSLYQMFKYALKDQSFTLEPFGSSVNTFSRRSSDIDVMLIFPIPTNSNMAAQVQAEGKDSKDVDEVEILRKLSAIFTPGDAAFTPPPLNDKVHYRVKELVTETRVPVLKLEHLQSGLEARRPFLSCHL